MGGLTQPYQEGEQLLYNFANIGAFVQETIVNAVSYTHLTLPTNREV